MHLQRCAGLQRRHERPHALLKHCGHSNSLIVSARERVSRVVTPCGPSGSSEATGIDRPLRVAGPPRFESGSFMIESYQGLRIRRTPSALTCSAY